MIIFILSKAIWIYCFILVRAVIVVAQLSKIDRTFVTNYQYDLFVLDFKSWNLRSQMQYKMESDRKYQMLLKRQIRLFCSVETLPQACTMYDIRQENSKVVHNSDQLPSDHTASCMMIYRKQRQAGPFLTNSISRFD